MATQAEKIAVMPRPRTHWQAIDAGMLFARHHYFKLVTLWLILAVPVVVTMAISLALGLHWVIAALIYWWLKPLYELPLLMYLSRALFGDSTSVRQALRESKPHWLRLLKSYLSLSRLSPARSTTAAVVFLEQQTGSARRSRVSVLMNDTTRSTTLLMALLHIELFSAYSLLLIVTALFPTFLGSQALIASAIAPLYVSSGFMLYINRRMKLEAWDIEHKFHDVQIRHKKPTQFKSSTTPLAALTLTSALIVGSVLSFTPLTPAYADTELPRVDTVRDSVQRIHDSPLFGNTENVTRYRWKDNDNSALDNIDFEWGRFSDIFDFLLDASRIIVFLAAGILIAVVAMGIVKFLPDSWYSNTRRRPTLDLLSEQHHPLTRSLPDDIAAAAKAALDSGDQRAATSLLYRGALRCVMRRHQLAIPSSATEQECRTLIERCGLAKQSNAFNRVVNEWSELAYGKEAVSIEQSESLIDFWLRSFSDSAAVTVDNIEHDAAAGHAS